MGQQKGIPTVVMRGGTSKGLYFKAEHLPGPGPERDALLLRLMGSPDILQIDGLGGSRPITSKVAIVSPSARADADVDYTFAQVDITSALVGYSGNCGNISSGVGPFAIDEGMVEAHDGVTDVRIFNTNTQRVIIAAVPVLGGAAAVLGDCAIAGVPGTGAEIVLNFVHTIGGRTGAFLPSGSVVDQITTSWGDTVAGTLCDVGNPVFWLRAETLGLSGSELADRINDDYDLIARVCEIRGHAAVLAGLCQDWRAVDEQSPGLPLVGLVSPPEDYRTLGGTDITRGDIDLRVRLIFMNRLHGSIAGTASVNLAAASRLPGSVVAEVAGSHKPDALLIGQPSGVTPVHVTTTGRGEDGLPRYSVLGLSRTARRLMSGTAWVPA